MIVIDVGQDDFFKNILYVKANFWFMKQELPLKSILTLALTSLM